MRALGKPVKKCSMSSWMREDLFRTSEKSCSWCLGGKIAVHEQVGRLGERGALGQFLDGDAAVTQDALVAVDEGDGALTGAGVARSPCPG